MLAASLATLGPLACGSTSPVTDIEGTAAGSGSGGHGGEAGGMSGAGAGEGGGAGDGSAGEGGAPSESAPWDAGSRHIELECFGFFDGPMLFIADRDQLTPAELAQVEGLRRTQPSDGYCSSDPLNCRVAITGSDGQVVEYEANEQDASCGGDPVPMLARASVNALRDTINCKFSQHDAGPLVPSEGCWHGMHNEPLHQQLALQEANRRYHVEAMSCQPGGVELELFGEDPSVPLAIGEPVAKPGPHGLCTTLDVQVEGPLIADLVMTPKGVDGPDFFINFR